MAEIVRMSGANGEGLKTRRYKELVFPDLDGMDPDKGLKYVQEFNYRQSDIIVCSFPKSGTHWIGNMLWKLKSIDDAADRPRDTVIELGPPETYDLQVDPRIMFTHLRPGRIYSTGGKGKVVLMLRNPKDSAVSFFYHLKNAKVHKNKQTWDEYFHSYITGEIFCGSYFTYLKEWEQVLKEIGDGKRDMQVEVFYFEDFLLNPKENISRLNRFLEFGRDDEYLDRVLEETAIAALRQHYNSHADKLVHITCCDDAGKSIIFRKGKVGDWKNHFTVAQSEMVDHLLQDALQHKLIDFRYGN